MYTFKVNFIVTSFPGLFIAKNGKADKYNDMVDVITVKYHVRKRLLLEAAYLSYQC